MLNARLQDQNVEEKITKPREKKYDLWKFCKHSQKKCDIHTWCELTFIWWKSTIETLEKGVKYVQS